jgi:hypothetical protein
VSVFWSTCVLEYLNSFPLLVVVVLFIL